MGYIKWSDDFIIGNVSIDNQHKKLVDIINTLYKSVENSDSNAILDEMLAELKSYTIYHFKTEETFMKDTAYKHFNAHKKIHQSFVRKIEEFEKEYINGNQFISIDLLNFLTVWIVEHIKKEDMKFSSYT